VSTTRRFSIACIEVNCLAPLSDPLPGRHPNHTGFFSEGEVMTRFIRNSFSTSTSLVRFGILAIALVGCFAAAPQAASATTFTVNTTVDLPDVNPGDGICNTGVATCSLRAAITESDFIGGTNVINVPSGTYTLTLGPFDDEFNGLGASPDSGDLDICDFSAFSLPQLISVTINGAGAGTTIINGGDIDRVLDINNFAASGAHVDVTLSGLTITNGTAPTTPDSYNESGGGIQFDGFDNQTFQPAGTLTITNCNITNHSAAGQGGGILAIFGSLVMSGSQVSGNTSVNAAGGGISYDGSSFSGLRTLQITTSRITGNSASNGTFGSGGGVSEGGNATKTINYSVITNNTAGNQGGGVFNGSGDLTMNYNVIVDNTATAVASSSGFRNNTGTINADNNWWGCNQGPSFAPCNRASGPLGGGILAWLTLNHTATPNTIQVNQSTTLQADFFTNNLSTGISPADLVALNGRPVVFNNAVLGTISGADPTINAGKANATFTAGPTPGSGSADATVDHATVTALITITEAPTAPSITSNPANQTVCDGGTATFTASASGNPTPTVQWEVSTNGGLSFAPISGATNTTLMFTATAADNGNQYRAVFTNSEGSATTTAATLTVNTAPVVTTNPVNTTVCDGATATFTAAASGSASVQWQVSSGGPFSDIPGATSTTLMFTATAADNGKQYRAVFTNACGTATTTAATLTVQPSTTTSDPADATVCQGATANFSTTAGGTGPFSYSWTVDGSPAGTNSPNLAVNTTSLSVGNHTVSVTTTGACGSASQSATLTVQAQTATTDPADATVCQGATANFSTTASGTGPFSYSWTVDGSPAGTNSPNLAVDTTSLSVGNHTVSVTTTGTCGSASQSATLTVNANTTTTDPADATVCQGATANFSTTAGGTGPFSYSWTVDGSPAGTNSPNLAVNTTSLSVGNHTVSVTTTGACGSASQSATLTVQAQTATTDPADATVCQGATANFSTTASGTGPFSYAWTVDGSPAGTNSPNLAVNTTSLNVGNHTVSVTTTGTCGSASQSATLTVLAPTATTDPPDQTVCKGATATFSTTASGTGPFHYAWTLDGLPYGGDSSTINIPTGALTSGPHTVTVTTTGACGSASQSATLTVGSPPVITLSTTTVSMWPPNHNYRTFNVSDFVSSASGCDGDLTSSVVIASVSSDEPEDSPSGGDGTTLNDIVIAPDCKSVQLRRERDGNLNGRVYTITFSVADSQGNTTTATVTVTVPVNKNGTAVNGPGPGYSVTGSCP